MPRSEKSGLERDNDAKAEEIVHQAIKAVIDGAAKLIICFEMPEKTHVFSVPQAEDAGMEIKIRLISRHALSEATGIDIPASNRPRIPSSQNPKS